MAGDADTTKSGSATTVAYTGDVPALPAKPKEAAGDPLIGAVLEGKYAVDALIGVGGMGRVYRGRNLRTEHAVAIKTLIPQMALDDSFVKRFEVEAKSASSLSHPNTIRVYDHGSDAGVLYMVMELLNGASLEQELTRTKKLAPARLVHIMRQVCLALSEAHGRGMIHRDLKPDNIFLNRSGEEEDIVKVLDFGVAKLMEPKFGSEDLTQAGTIFGTPRYMSPEQARGLKLDARADIYALGVIMYEAVAGVPPFDGNDTISILIKHCNEPVPTLPESVESLQSMPGLEALIRRCLAKTPEERPASVRDLRQELEQLGESWRGRDFTGAVVIEPSASNRATSGSGPAAALADTTTGARNKAKFGIAAVAILAAVGGLFALSRQGPTAPSPLPAADAVTADAAPLGSAPTQGEQAPAPSAASAAAPSAAPAATPPAAVAVEQAGAGVVATKTEAAASASKSRAPTKPVSAVQATARPETAVAEPPKPAPQEPPAQVAAIEPPKVAPPAPAPAAPSAAGPMVLPAGASEPDCVTGQTQPAFPSRARDAGVEGEVSVKIAVNADGTVSLVKILKSDPFFDDAVKSHLKTLRCRPARLNGSAISVFKNLRFPFRRSR